MTVGMVSDTVAEIKGGFLKEGDSVCVPSVDNQILRAMGLSSADVEITSAAQDPFAGRHE